MRPGRTGGTRWWLVGAVCLAGLSPSRAEDTMSPMQFWLSQGAKPRPPTQRGRQPTAGPRSASASGARRQQTTSPASAEQQAAFVVAVFGDGFAYDLGRGLTDAFDDASETGVFDATDEAMGATQEPTSVWGDTIEAARAAVGHLEAAVIMLGSADLKPLADGHGGVADPGTAAWREAYGARVETIAAAFRDRHLPLIWVGLPLVRDAALASRYADLNAVIRDHAPKGGATFVDCWEAFADDSGQYSANGPDLNGRDARLRRADGARFTGAGARKLASFVEGNLKRELERAEASRKLASVGTDESRLFDQALEVDVNAQIRREAGLPPLSPVESARTKEGPVLELTAVPMATEGRLATRAAPVAMAANAVAILGAGIVPPPRPGRTDDFSWPRH